MTVDTKVYISSKGEISVIVRHEGRDLAIHLDADGVKALRGGQAGEIWGWLQRVLAA